MQKKKKDSLLNILIIMCFAFLVILGSTMVVQAKPSDISPDIFEYTTSSTVGAWYDEKSDCFVFQTLNGMKTNDNFYRTIIYEFSRIKKDVNPKDSIYVTDKEATVFGNDPHYYIKTDASDNYEKNINGTYYEREYISFFREAAEYKERYPVIDGKTHVYGTYVIDKNYVLNAIQKNYPDWYAEIEEKRSKNQTAWLGIDAVICVHWPKREDAIYSPSKIGGKWTGFTDIFDGHTFGAGKYYRWSNWEDLGSTYGFTLGSLSSGKDIFTSYNQYIPVSSDIKPGTDDPNPKPPEPEDTPDPDPEPPKPEDTPDDDVDVIKTYEPSNVEKIIGYNGSYNTLASPYVYTYNTSDEFDLGIGIPSSETYTNGIEVSPWYGSVKIRKHDVTLNAYIPYLLITTQENIIKKEIKILSKTLLPAGEYNGIYYPEEPEAFDGKYYIYRCWYYANENEVVYYEGIYTYQDEATYYAIEEVNLFGHDNSKVQNDFSQTIYDIDTSVPYDITVNGKNVNSKTGTAFSTTTFSANTGYHVHIPEALSRIQVMERTTEKIQNSDEARAYVEKTVLKNLNGDKLKTKNDYISLDGFVYLDSEGLQITPVEEVVSITNGSTTNVVKDLRYYISSAEDDLIKEEQSVLIPAETQNNDYYTYFRVDYKNFAAGSSLAMLEFNGNAEGKPGIKEEYKENEPIRVHTPVISPISIVGEDETQLIQKVQSPETQLILDNTYTVTFDWNDYFNKKGYTRTNFTKYVMKKEVSFPFDVIVNNVLYKASESSGRTEWIDVDNVDSFDFYIPSWAKEGIYGSDVFKDYEYYSYEPITVRVYAINYIEDETEKWQEIANTDMAKYMATYDYAVQVSGVIYDFQVVSINDALLYGNDKNSDIYSFVTNKEERKFGVLNRFGETLRRYTIDGTMTSIWNSKFLLPLSDGSSTAYEELGRLYRGHTIGYTIKTISNLNGKTDTIEIVPTYRYIAPGGEEKEVSVYFTLGNSPYVSIYDDTYNRKTYIGSPYFENCYYDYGVFNPVTFTADYFNTTKTEVLYRETESHNAGNIVLYSTQKLLTGMEEELKVNKSRSTLDCLRYNQELLNLNTEATERFHASMQTWYGQYTIPTNIFICEKYEDGTDAYQRAVKEYGYVSDTSDIWLDNGYLVLNFDITTKKEGKVEDLRYEGGSLNMWERENGETTEREEVVTYYDPVTKEEITTIIPVEDGDVAIIDIEKTMSDKYAIGILYLN